MEKSLTILKIVLLSLLVIILTNILVLFINDDNNFSFNYSFNSKASLVYDSNIEEEFNKIDINSESLDIKIVKSKDDNVNVKVYDKEKDNVSIKVENNTLMIESLKRIKCVFCFYKSREVVISLPENIYDLVVNTKSGDILSDVSLNNVDIVSLSGDIAFDNIKEANIKSTSGDILVNEVDKIKFDSTSGDVLINKVNEQLNIETTSGDINIRDLT